MRRLAPVLVALLALALAPDAFGATVHVKGVCPDPLDEGETCGKAITFQAAPGEVNDVSVASAAAGVVVSDTGAPLSAGFGCTQVTPSSASCPVAIGSASLGDGNDKLTLRGRLAFEVLGEAGDDTLTGDSGADILRGGDGDDRLEGRGRGDVLDGGAGDDYIDGSERESERTSDSDELRCGAGRDRVAEPDIYDRASFCERVAVGGGLVVDSSTLVRRSGPRVEVVVRCARAEERCVAGVAAAAASGVAFTPRTTVRLAPGATRRVVLRRFHPGGVARLRRSRVIAFGTKDHGFAVRMTS